MDWGCKLLAKRRQRKSTQLNGLAEKLSGHFQGGENHLRGVENRHTKWTVGRNRGNYVGDFRRKGNVQNIPITRLAAGEQVPQLFLLRLEIFLGSGLRLNFARNAFHNSNASGFKGRNLVRVIG